MSNRRKIEKCIVDEIRPVISDYGFKLVDKDLNLFEAERENVKWGIRFHLYNNKVYSLFCKVSVVYTDLTKIINDLLVDTELSDYFECGVGLTEDELRVTKSNDTLKIDQIDDVENFSVSFLDRIRMIEKLFWIPESNPISQMESFKKSVVFWKNSLLSQNIAMWVAEGIKENDVESVKYGLNRGSEALSPKSHTFEMDKLLIHILKDKLSIDNLGNVSD